MARRLVHRPLQTSSASPAASTAQLQTCSTRLLTRVGLVHMRSLRPHTTTHSLHPHTAPHSLHLTHCIHTLHLTAPYFIHCTPPHCTPLSTHHTAPNVTPPHSVLTEAAAIALRSRIDRLRSRNEPLPAPSTHKSQLGYNSPADICPQCMAVCTQCHLTVWQLCHLAGARGIGRSGQTSR